MDLWIFLSNILSFKVVEMCSVLVRLGYTYLYVERQVKPRTTTIPAQNNSVIATLRTVVPKAEIKSDALAELCFILSEHPSL